MSKRDFDHLLDKYKAGKCSPDEIAFLESWYLTYEESHKELLSLTDRKEDVDRVWNNLKDVSYKRQILIWPKLAIAASILLFLSVGSFFLPHKQTKQSEITKNKIHDVGPGGNKAILILSNGKQIVLTGAQNGKLAQQGNTIIKKTSNGQIVYLADERDASVSGKLTYNTMSTPKGGQYWVILPDGSKVFLNAASSLRYPTAFIGKERIVELTGEAYFEVAHNASVPFKVINKGQAIEVLGTHFNINSYGDESFITTTLLEGSVKVHTKNQEIMLKPGQQSEVNTDSDQHNITLIDNVDIEEVIAWKNGLFQFKAATIKQVMDNAARWYDINVIYKGMPDVKITGRMSRNVNLSGLIDLLKFEGIKLKTEGKNVTIVN
ncbi:MAG: fec operon regulator FecR [Mucilaginibacter sp.]|nr:fec operon regulator FecR [Mucilaginibacter sp.]